MTVESAASDPSASVFTTDPFLLKNGSKRTVRCLEKALQTEHVLGCAGEVGANLLTMLVADITRTLVSLLKYLTQWPWSQLFHEFQLESAKSGYVLGGPVP